MEMASARRPMRTRQSDQIVLWGACVLLSALSLLLVAVSSGFDSARLSLAARGISVLARTTRSSSSSAVDDVVIATAEHCGVDDDEDDNSMFVGGEWVRDDDRRPLYEPWQCPFVDKGFRCRENGRLDDVFAKWRWQPRHCTLPRFDAKHLLEMLRNRWLVFVGDR